MAILFQLCDQVDPEGSEGHTGSTSTRQDVTMRNDGEPEAAAFGTMMVLEVQMVLLTERSTGDGELEFPRED